MSQYRTLADKKGRLAHLQSESRKLFASKPDMDFTEDEVKSLQQMNAEMNDLGVEIEQLSELQDMQKALGSAPSGEIIPNGGASEPRQPAETKSWEERLRESADYKRFV